MQHKIIQNDETILTVLELESSFCSFSETISVWGSLVLSRHPSSSLTSSQSGSSLQTDSFSKSKTWNSPVDSQGQNSSGIPLFGVDFYTDQNYPGVFEKPLSVEKVIFWFHSLFMQHFPISFSNEALHLKYKYILQGSSHGTKFISSEFP